MSRELKPYIVTSEEYVTRPSCWDPPEPPEYGSDYAEVMAFNKRQAVLLGVAKILKEQGHNCLAWENRGDQLPPWAGHKAQLAICEHGRPWFRIDAEGKTEVLPCEPCDAASPILAVLREAAEHGGAK